MADENDVVRRALALGAAVLVALGLAAIDSDPAGIAASVDLASDSASLAAPATTALPDMTDGVPPPAESPPSSLAPPAEPPSAAQPAVRPVDPGPLTPPAVGAYRYVVVPEDDEDGERLVRIRVRLPQGARASDPRREFVDYDDGSVSLLSWRPAGVFLERTGDDVGESSCDWDPDVLTYAPLKVGASWENDSKCTHSFEEEQINVHMTTKSKVTASKRTRIDDEEVDVWVIETTATIVTESRFAGDVEKSTQRMQDVAELAARLGIEVRAVTTTSYSSDAPDAPAFEETEQRELLSLHPR